MVELEQELADARAEARRFRRIFESNDDVVTLVSAEQRVAYITPRGFETVTGLRAEQGHPVLKWLHPDDEPSIARRLEALVASGPGARARVEFRHQHGDGSWIWFESVACNLLDDPDVNGVIVISRRNDDAVRLREELRAATERYEIAQRISHEAVWERNLRDGTMIFSPAATALLGYTADELPLNVDGSFVLVHPDDVAAQETLLESALRGGAIANSEMRVRHKSGEYRWIHVHREILSDSEGNATRLIAHATDIHDRKVAEARLRDSERRHRALFEGTTVAVLLYDSHDQRFIDCNAAALKLYEVGTRDELRDTLPTDLSALNQPDGSASAEVARALTERALVEGSTRTEWLARKRSGETFMSDLRISVIDLDDGRRILQVLVEDVSERKRTERTLLQRSRRDALIGRVSRLLVDGAADAALVIIGAYFGSSRVSVQRVRSEGVVETLAAWTMDEAPGTDPTHHDDPTAPSVLATLRTDGWALAQGSLLVPLVDQRLVVGWIALADADAPHGWTEDDIAVARLLAEILSIGHARSQAEALTRLTAMRDELIGEISRRFLDEGPENALDAVLERVGTRLDFERVSLFAPDSEGRRLTCTHRWSASGAEIGWESLEAYPVPVGVFEQIVGTSPSSAERSNFRIDEWLTTLQRDAGTRTLQAPIGYGGRVFGLLVARLRPARGWNDDDAVTLRSVGEVVAVARVRRAAELALAEAKEAAVAASAAKSSFLANISHELRTPLNGVIGMVDLLAGTPLDPHQQRFCDVARSSANALLAVINDVLDFSKIEANKLELDVAPFDLRGLVDEAVEMLALQAQSRGLELLARTDPAVLHVLGDAARVRQVLVNLVSNAIKFTPKGTVSVRSRLTTEVPGEVRVRIEVEDTGVGLPLDADRLLFKPFSQIDGSSARRQGGTGLGLAISRDLVERMGGTIGVTSELGRGSTFWFELPLARAASPIVRSDHGEARVSTVPTAGPLARRRVLVVEDSPVNALVTTELLRRAGAEYELVEDGKLALEASRRTDFDLILMDCHLPEMDGYETTRRLRALGVRTPIVALTASATTEDLARCFAAGMNDRIVKPVDARRFIELVRRHIEDRVAPEVPRGFDLAGALERMRGDRDLFHRVCSRFSEIAPGERRALAAAVQSRDARVVAALGHRLRGQAGALGGHSLMEALAALESVAGEARWAAASAALLAVESELDQLLLALAKVGVG